MRVLAFTALAASPFGISPAFAGEDTEDDPTELCIMAPAPDFLLGTRAKDIARNDLVGLLVGSGLAADNTRRPLVWTADIVDDAFVGMVPFELPLGIMASGESSSVRPMNPFGPLGPDAFVVGANRLDFDGNDQPAMYVVTPDQGLTIIIINIKIPGKKKLNDVANSFIQPDRIFGVGEDILPDGRTRPLIHDASINDPGNPTFSNALSAPPQGGTAAGVVATPPGLFGPGDLFTVGSITLNNNRTSATIWTVDSTLLPQAAPVAPLQLPTPPIIRSSVARTIRFIDAGGGDPPTLLVAGDGKSLDGRSYTLLWQRTVQGNWQLLEAAQLEVEGVQQADITDAIVEDVFTLTDPTTFAKKKKIKVTVYLSCCPAEVCIKVSKFEGASAATVRGGSCGITGEAQDMEGGGATADGFIGMTFAVPPASAGGAGPIGPDRAHVVRLRIQPPCLGDANGDGSVDFDDVLAILATFGEPGTEGDFDGDGVIGFDDLLVVLSSFGTICA